MDYKITTTSTCDLTKEILKEKDIDYLSFKFSIDGKEYLDNFFSDITYESFYDDIVNNKNVTTSQVGYGPYEEFFESILKSGNDVLHICLSSALSGDYQTAKMVAEELNEKYENKVYVIDSLGASSGYGMLVLKAYDNKSNGMSIIDNYNWCNNNKLRIHHWFISTDLSSYIKGGRISKAEGFFGTALKICPLMNMNKEGELKPLEKIRTKSKAIQGQLNKMIEFADNQKEYSDYCFISCSNCDDDANELKTMIQNEFKNIKDVKIFHVGTTIGSHTGKGTVALYFFGSSR